MKKTSVRWRIFTYNLMVVLMLMALTTVIFNISVGRYFERTISGQMERIAQRTEEMALLKGPEFFPPQAPFFPQGPEFLPPAGEDLPQDISPFYFMLDRSLREPLSVLDADYVLLDTAGDRIAVPFDPLFGLQPAVEDQLKKMAAAKGAGSGAVTFTVDEKKYIAVLRPVSDKNTFGLGWVILYSSLEKVEQIQGAVNVILLAILAFSAGVAVLFSSHMAHWVCAPFDRLDQHLRILAERKFGRQLTEPVDEELQGLVDTVNHLSAMLEKHDQAQKTFLQNVSHEFRTPLMAIQGHAEGIRHQVVSPEPAAEIILTETGRLTRLVENLLYLSRLDALEEEYDFKTVDLNALAAASAQQMQDIAAQKGIVLQMARSPETLPITCDEEKLFQAITNLISNGIRHGKTTVRVTVEAGTPGSAILRVQDDGPGIDPQELPRIFDRFYRGKSGKFGLGLAIVKAVTDRHNAVVTLENENPGACFRLEFPLDEVRL